MDRLGRPGERESASVPVEKPSPGGSPLSASPEHVLAFWFADARDSPERAAARLPVWFGADPQFDQLVGERFGGVLELAAEGRLAHWEAAASETLALVLLLDQFPRNVFRGTARAFATDALALAVAHRAFSREAHRALAAIEQIFLLLPFEHAESLAAQEVCVARARQIAASGPPEWSALMAGFVPHAEQHCEVIARFGRFPHRNRVLGRASTPAELAYLAAGAQTFGQHA